jgi:G:T-mismatch repair DNA endonuclease (very short patch repair protein)
MKVKCEKCGCEFDNKMFKLHVRNSHLGEFSNENEIELFVIKNRFNLNDELITELIGKYKNDGSVFSLVNEYGIPHKSLSLLFKLSDVKLKSSSEVAKQKSVREKYKSTCLNKYGVSNVSKSDEVKQKKKESFIENYGVDNIFKTDEFKDSINDIMLSKYGVKRIGGWDYLTDEQKIERIKKLNSGGSSKLEKRVGKILVEMGVNFETQFELKGKVYDYYIKGTNILIEVNGDFWHANPRKYKATDIIPFPKKEVTAESLWKKDEKKLNIALKSGYKVLPLWEMDIRPLDDIELELFITEKINNL